MFNHTPGFFAIVLTFVICGVGCSSGEAQKNTNAGASAEASPNSATKAGADAKLVATPAKNFTAADVAKLKWIEGTWRGMDGDKPFFERYKIEGTTMVVDGFADETLAKVTDTDRFELKNGEFGKGEGDKRSAASEITDRYIQFVPAVAGKGNSFRFEDEGNGTWTAILEWQASGEKTAGQKIYKMEPWPAK